MSRQSAGRLILLFALLLPAGWACGDDQPAEPDEPEPRLTTIEVTPSSATLSALESTQDFEATAKDQNGNTLSGVTFSWSVSPDSVATVDDTGTVMAEANGSATVEAAASGVTGSADLTVDQEVAQLAVSPDSMRFELVGDTQRFTAEATDPNGHSVRDPSVGWATLDSAVARVDNEGLVTAGRVGETVVRATAGGQSASAPVEAEATGVAGPNREPVNDHLPRLSFVVPDQEEFTETGEGILVATRYLTLAFAGQTTIEEANQFLQENGASILGATGRLNTIYVRVPERSLSDASQLMEELAADSRTTSATLDFGGFEDARLPPHNRRDVRYNWAGDQFVTNNWPQQTMRLPQFWNIKEEVSRGSIEHTSCALIIEKGPWTVLPPSVPDTDHEDLDFTQTVNGDDEHATAVAGLLGAQWGNALGMESPDPWLDRMVAIQFAPPIWSQLIREFGQAIAALPLPRPFRPTAVFSDCDSGIVNLSFSLEGEAGFAQKPLIRKAAADLRAALAFGHERGLLPSRTFLVAAAGNDGLTDEDEAQYSSPMTFNAAGANGADMERPSSWLTVEATRPNEQVAVNSNQPPQSVAAPGEQLNSTGSGDRYDVGGDVGGTSFSAPLVSGLLSALSRVSRAFAIPSFGTSGQPTRRLLKTLLSEGDYTRTIDGTNAGGVDAFAALLGLDQETGGTTVQAHLVNVDDGTRDGNLRVNPFSGNPVSDSRPERTVIDVADFRAYRDAFLQIHKDRVPERPGVLLDGPETHLKKDLNRDGCVGNQPATFGGDPVRSGFDNAKCTEGGGEYPENLFPRFDFNGNGKMAREGDRTQPGADAVAPFKADPDRPCDALDGAGTLSGCLRDLDVLATPEIWDGKEAAEKVSVEDVEEGIEECTPPDADWNTTALLTDRDGDGIIDYMRSFDLHVRLRSGASELDTPAGSLLHATTRAEDGEARAPFPDFDPDGFVLRHGPIDGGEFVKCRTSAFENTVTVPVLGPEEDTTKVLYQRKHGQEDDSDNQYVELELTPKLGEDFALEIAPDEPAFTLKSTSRERSGDFLGAREIIWRDRADPASAVGAYANSQCLADPEGEHGTSELHERMTTLAEQTWVTGEDGEPGSLLKEWLGAENVEVADPIVRGVDRQRFKVAATGTHPLGCVLGLGTLYCWGAVPGLPDLPEDATIADRNTPRPLDTDVRFESFDVGSADLQFTGSNVCGIGADEGLAYCWGSEESGAIGDGTNQARSRPTRVAGQDSIDFLDVRTSKSEHTCGVSEDGGAYCWGENSSGQLGDGTIDDSNEPIPVSGDQEWRQVDVELDYSCGVTTEGTAYCWGKGPLGNGSVRDTVLSPVEVAGDHSFRQTDVGSFHACGLTPDGDVLCWGRNADGQLGDGSTINRGEPVQVASLPEARQVSAGARHSCAVTTDDEVYCWGDNDQGQLGDAAAAGNETMPVRVVGGIKWGTVTAWDNFTCGTSTENDGHCWGGGDGSNLGDGEDHSDHEHIHDTPRSVAPAMTDCPSGQRAGRLWGAWIRPTRIP